MPKSLRWFVWVVLIVLAGPAQARQTAYRWERMSVVHASPSQVFARLGLTHYTRHGFTRDGFKKTDPDPTFPPGLTDIVPQDISHILLVRGTPEGLAAFRARVAAADNNEIVAPLPTPTGWHVTVSLLPAQGDGPQIGVSAEQDVIPNRPFVVTVGDPARPETYRLNLRLLPNAQTALTFQAGLLLPSPDGAGVRPPQAWTVLVTQIVPLGAATQFLDSAAAKQSARRRLAWPQEDQPQDFLVRVTVTAPAAPTAPVPAPDGAP